MLVQTLVSVAGIVLVVLLVRWLGVRQPASPLDSGTAAGLAELAGAGFETESVVLDAGASAAIVTARDGRFALVRPHGAQWTVRILAAPVTATVESADLIVDSGDAMFGKVRLRLGEESAHALAARMQASQAGQARG